MMQLSNRNCSKMICYTKLCLSPYTVRILKRDSCLGMNGRLQVGHISKGDSVKTQDTNIPLRFISHYYTAHAIIQ